MTKRVMIMAGGTGGHVYPALAVAERLRAADVDIVWIGTKAGLEARVVPAAGIPIAWINVKGLRGKGLFGWLLAPIRVARAAFEAARVIRKQRPDAILGMGGFVSGPGGLVARLFGTPLLIHEQNAVAGLTNRVLSRIATRVFTGFPNTLARGEFVGNPVRQAFVDVRRRGREESTDTSLRLLVVGGSQGARALNEVVPDAVADVANHLDVFVRHQSGRGARTALVEAYRQVAVDADVEEFIDDMADAYAKTDVVICRAGAMTVAEIAAASVAAIFVPYPYAVSDHQTANARYLVDRGGAYLIDEANLDANGLAARLLELGREPERRQRMGEQAALLAKIGATTDIADACLEVMHA